MMTHRLLVKADRACHVVCPQEAEMAATAAAAAASAPAHLQVRRWWLAGRAPPGVVAVGGGAAAVRSRWLTAGWFVAVSAAPRCPPPPPEQGRVAGRAPGGGGSSGAPQPCRLCLLCRCLCWRPASPLAPCMHPWTLILPWGCWTCEGVGAGHFPRRTRAGLTLVAAPPALDRLWFMWSKLVAQRVPTGHARRALPPVRGRGRQLQRARGKG